MTNKVKYVVAGVSGIATLIWIALIKLVDVAAIGPNGTSIGLSHINMSVHEILGESMLWYNITEVLGIVAILTAGAFALYGGVQLIKGKSLAKVDREIYVLGGLYAAVIILYALFEKVIINYRPIIMPDCEEPEASFPSSHTMLICVVMGSAIMLLNKYIENEKLRVVLQIICGAILVVTVVGRLLSGAHWFTDIIGGILISITLLAVFSAIKDGK